VAGVVRLWLDLFAPRPFLLPCLSDLVYQRLRIEIVGIYRWRRRKSRWGRISLDDAEVGQPIGGRTLLFKPSRGSGVPPDGWSVVA
jgi:hypothetical protein